MSVTRTVIAAFVAVIGLNVVPAYGADELNIIAGCNIDLNGDKIKDIAMVVESSGKKRLIVLIDSGNDIRATVLSSDVGKMELHCRHDREIVETKSGKSKGNRFPTPGAYLELVQPEGASVAFLWMGKKFREVWTAD